MERHPKKCTFVLIILRKGSVIEEFSTFGTSGVVRTHPEWLHQNWQREVSEEKLGILLF